MHGNTIILAPEEVTKICSLYTNGSNVIGICEETGLGSWTVRRVLEENGIQYRSGYGSMPRKKVNEHFFDLIDNEVKAYFLGFIFADGCNYRQKEDGSPFEVSLCIQARDKHILETFRDLLVPNYELWCRKSKVLTWQDQFRLRLNNKPLSDQLNKLGCTPRKSLTLQYPTIPDHLQHHFIRGYFDGDGCIYRQTNQTKRTVSKRFSFEIVSTSMFCESASLIIEQAIDIKPKLYPCGSNGITTSLCIRGNPNTVKIFDWLYYDATIFIQRKHEKYLDLKDHVASLENHFANTGKHINQYY